MENDEESLGLVISDITAREKIYQPRFVTEEELSKAINMIPALGARAFHDLRPRYSVQLSPGSVKISYKSFHAIPKSENYKPKSEIITWSSKSRSSMISRICSLDFSSMLGDYTKAPAMITLTYPKNWEELAPNGQAAKRHLRMFQKRFQREFRRPLVGIWKMEFQRRGAPHFHIFCVPPSGQGFAEWLSKSWTEIVNPTSTNERAKHLLAGTGLDYSTGLKSTDPKRVSVYFMKHSSASFGNKEYQNKPPKLWVEARNIGRFWGYWELKPLELKVEISDRDALLISRTLRRWSKANSKAVRVEVWREDTKSKKEKNKDGKVLYKRHVKRPIRRMSQRSGFISVNDGSQIGRDLARAIALQRPRRC